MYTGFNFSSSEYESKFSEYCKKKFKYHSTIRTLSKKQCIVYLPIEIDDICYMSISYYLRCQGSICPVPNIKWQTGGTAHSNLTLKENYK